VDRIITKNRNIYYFFIKVYLFVNNSEEILDCSNITFFYVGIHDVDDSGAIIWHAKLIKKIMKEDN